MKFTMPIMTTIIMLKRTKILVTRITTTALSSREHMMVTTTPQAIIVTWRDLWTMPHADRSHDLAVHSEGFGTVGHGLSQCTANGQNRQTIRRDSVLLWVGHNNNMNATPWPGTKSRSVPSPRAPGHSTHGCAKPPPGTSVEMAEGHLKAKRCATGSSRAGRGGWSGGSGGSVGKGGCPPTPCEQCDATGDQQTPEEEGRRKFF